MKKVGIFYGSTLGNCKNVADKIRAELGLDIADVINIETAGEKSFDPYENLIFGTSTWGVGEMHEDWENFSRHLKNTNLAAKKVALFGIGNQKEWADSFVNGMAMLHHHVAQMVEVVGYTPIADYDFEISLAVKENQFVGLAIDEVNQADLTARRIKEWVAHLKKVFL